MKNISQKLLLFIISLSLAANTLLLMRTLRIEKRLADISDDVASVDDMLENVGDSLTAIETTFKGR